MEIIFVKVKTKGDLILQGVLARAQGKTIVINIHGTAGNFHEEMYIRMLENFPHSGISFLSANNRGAYAYQGWEPSGGSAVEYFEDCIADIDAWIKFALGKGYENIILQGHSLGTEKVVYYMAHGMHREEVRAVILLSFADSYGTQMNFLKEKG